MYFCNLKRMKNAESGLGLGLAKTYHTIALFPQTALLESTRSKRFNTLLLEDIPPVALKLRCCDIILPSLKKKAEPLSSSLENLAATYSRTSYTSTTIGNTAFDGRVDGIGSDHSFITTKNR